MRHSRGAPPWVNGQPRTSVARKGRVRHATRTLFRVVQRRAVRWLNRGFRGTTKHTKNTELPKMEASALILRTTDRKKAA
jgi:hypothetical protein